MSVEPTQPVPVEAALSDASPSEASPGAHWKRRPRAAPIPREEAARQGAITQLAFLTLGREDAIAFLNTIAAPAAAIIGWLIIEKIKDGKPTSIGAASGAVAGLVAITPACAVLSPFWAIVGPVIAGLGVALLLVSARRA